MLLRSPDLDFGFAFTAHDTPTVRARIERDLEHIARRAHASDPHLRALVLCGGFSRGEGSVRDGVPINDYDLVAVRRAPGGDVFYTRTSAVATADIGLEVDILPIWDQRLPWVGRKLFWLDVRLGGRVIIGEPAVLKRLRHFEPARIERVEIARLLGNRAAGLLLALPAPGEPTDAPLRDLQATKAALAAMDATLLHRREYAPTLRERLALVTDHPDHPTFALAVQWKLRPHNGLPTAWWERGRDALLRAVEATGARDADDGLAERLVHAARAKRIARAPSQTIRCAAWELLGSATYPNGPADLDGLSWGLVKASFFSARRMTLQ